MELDVAKFEAIMTFLKEMEGPGMVAKTVADRIDLATMQALTTYSEMLVQVRKAIPKLSDADFILCSMLIGFLVKGQTDRYDLNKSLEGDE